MNAKPATLSEADTRQQILDAAESRFRTYGYRKTTMAEIADDCRMSAANLYRYFENKQDMAAECANRCMGERIDMLREVVRNPGASAGDTLLEAVLTSLRHTHEQASAQPKINELVEDVTSARPDLVHLKLEAEHALIAEILARGNQSGEFDVADVVATARSVHASLVLFEVPIFMGLYTLEQFEDMARNLVELLIRGLARR